MREAAKATRDAGSKGGNRCNQGCAQARECTARSRRGARRPASPIEPCGRGRTSRRNRRVAPATRQAGGNVYYVDALHDVQRGSRGLIAF